MLSIGLYAVISVPDTLWINHGLYYAENVLVYILLQTNMCSMRSSVDTVSKDSKNVGTMFCCSYKQAHCTRCSVVDVHGSVHAVNVQSSADKSYSYKLDRHHMSECLKTER